MAELKLANLSKRFASQLVVNGLNLSIKQGEFVSILGPSGCGKTTVLRMLAGFEKPSAGSIQNGDAFLASQNLYVPPEKRRISMVFQSYALWPHKNVFDNVAYPVQLKKQSQRVVREATNRALSLVEMQNYGQRQVHELSGGQKQRVALARALVSEPEIILLDEPLANLDRHLRATMEDHFREFHKRTGATLIYVTHDQSEAMSLSERIAVLHQGHLQQWDTPENLYQKPNNQWVAEFIGQGSLVYVSNAPAQKELSSEQLQQGLCAKSDAATAVIIRPQQILIESGGIEYQVKRSIFRGSHYEVHLEHPQLGSLCAHSQSMIKPSKTCPIKLKSGWALSS